MAQRADAAAKANVLTFQRAGERYIESHKAGWRNPKHAKLWEGSLSTYAYPVLGRMAVNTITTAKIVEVLDPLWRTKTETATRVRMRMQAVLDYATAQGWRSGDNPARWRGLLDKILPAPRKVTKVEHHPSLPYAGLPSFLADAKAQGGTAPLALRFAILTACRTGEAIGARWKEFDLDKALWTVPAERMKSDREHRVPLSRPALEILQELLPLMTKPADFVFAGQGKAGHLSNMALAAVLRRMGQTDVTTHGFRSSFRNWAAEMNPAPREVAEMALAHALGSKTEAAYMRSDLFDLRAKLMADWGAYCCPPSPETPKQTIFSRVELGEA